MYANIVIYSIITYQYIAKNVRQLYGLPPDTEYHNGISGQRSVYHAYGRYYLHLATKFVASGRRSASAGRGEQETLFGYMQSVGMVTDARRNRGSQTSGCRTDHRPPPPKYKILMARLPATEYLRGGQCAHADQAVARLQQQQTCVESPRPPSRQWLRPTVIFYTPARLAHHNKIYTLVLLIHT